MSFGSNSDGGFNNLSKDYKKTPTLKNYLNLRRSNPGVEIEVSVHGGLDALLYMENELIQYGFDPQKIAASLDANEEAISQVCLQLMEKIIEVRVLEASGETQTIARGLTMPDQLIDWLICLMLDSLSWNNKLEIPRDLIVLTRDRLVGNNPRYNAQMQAHKKNKQRNGSEQV